jgi:hypothetical protein
MDQVGVYGPMGVESFSSVPGGRFASMLWTDSYGNPYLFGGQGYGSSSTSEGRLNDVWYFNISSLMWKWLRGSSNVNQAGTFGSIGTESSNYTPGGRSAAVLWNDSYGNSYLFGGQGYGSSSTSEGRLNDLWYFNTSSLNWKWLKGSSEIDQIGFYEQIGVESVNNTPGGRQGSVLWTDSSGNSYLFGGGGYGSSTSGNLNDVWYFNISSLNWKWMKGSSEINQIGEYGFAGIESITNTPG